MTALRSLEIEKDISLELVVKAIEEALLIAYHRTEGAAPKARVELDRKSGHVTVWATETPAEGADEEPATEPRESDDTPANNSRFVVLFVLLVFLLFLFFVVV